MILTNKSYFKILILALSFLQLFSGVAIASEALEELSVSDIAKTSAAKKYIAKQYSDSLVEFKTLEMAHPNSSLVKRYIASLHDLLGNQSLAISKLNDALKINKRDQVAMRMKGDILLKQGFFEEAEKEYQKVLAESSQGVEAEHARKKIEQIRGMQNAELPPGASSKMPFREFMRSEPARHFANQNDEKAIEGFERLLIKYPKDVLIYRFLGIAQSRQKDYQGAIQSFKQGLAIEPNNSATRYYLAQAYAKVNRNEESRDELHWLIDHGDANYKEKARRALFGGLKKGGTGQSTGYGKRFGFTTVAGFDYDTNATYKSRDDRFSTAGDQNSARFPLTVAGNYRFYEKGALSFSGDALYAHNLYTDIPTLKTYTSGGGVSSLYRTKLFQRPAFFNVRYGVAHTMLRNKFFVWSQNITPSFVFFPHARLRSTISYRLGINQYASNGFNPDQTSRDGFANNISWVGNIYHNKAKSFYTTYGYDYERVDTTGKNYVKNAHGFLWGIHFPILKKLEGDITFRFRGSDFPKYSFDPPARRDDLFVLTPALTYALTQNLSLTTAYTFETTKAKNNLYEYYKNVFSVYLSYRY